MIQHFSLSENVAWQRFVLQIVTFLKIFQGFSLFSYQCSLAVLCCISQRQLVYNSTSVIFCQQLFSSFSEIFLRSSTRKPSSCISVSIRCLPSHQRQLCYTIMSRIFCQQLFYLFFNLLFFITIDVGLPAMLPAHSVHRQDESPLFFLLHQDRLSVKYMSQIQVSPLLPLSVPPC